jgi:hypothetical protein
LSPLLFHNRFLPAEHAKDFTCIYVPSRHIVALASATSGVAVQAQSAGGLQEWSTDQAVDEKSIPDADAKALQKKAKAEDICVPIGEGENCW